MGNYKDAKMEKLAGAGNGNYGYIDDIENTIRGVLEQTGLHNHAETRVGDVFLKIDADQTRTDVEVEAMAMSPVPTPEVLWRKPPLLALAVL